MAQRSVLLPTTLLAPSSNTLTTRKVIFQNFIETKVRNTRNALELKLEKIYVGTVVNTLSAKLNGPGFESLKRQSKEII